MKDLPDLVLMDIGLPDMSDMKLFGVLHRKTLFNSGCVDYISKPLDTEKLLSVLSKYL